MTKIQYIIFLFSFCCVIHAVSATEPDYFVVSPTLTLYQAIPEEASSFLLSNKDNKGYQPKIEGKVLAVLKEGDIVRVKPREKGKYQDALCHKDSSKQAQHDWIATRDWLCVEVISANDQEKQGDTGWLHRLGTVAVPSTGTQTTLTFYVQDFRPFTTCQARKPAGVGVEIVKSVCNTMGEKVKCDFLCEDWDKAQELSKEKNRGLFFISRTEDREEYYFLSPVVQTEYGFFTLKGSSWKYEGDASLTELLKNRKIDAYSPSETSPSGTYTYFKKLVQDHPSLPASPRYRTTDEALDGLGKGEIDVLYSSKEVAESHAKEKSLDIQYAGRHQIIKYYVGLSKTTPKVIAAWFKSTLLAKKPEIDQILRQNRLQSIDQ